MRCLLCHEDIPAAETLDHFRLMHPDLDVEPETWPDGGVVWDEDFETAADVA